MANEPKTSQMNNFKYYTYGAWVLLWQQLTWVDKDLYLSMFEIFFCYIYIPPDPLVILILGRHKSHYILVVIAKAADQGTCIS